MTPTDRRIVQVIRETLEGVVAPNVGGSLLFDALRKWGQEPPGTMADYIRFVRGPVMELLVTRLGAAEAAAVRGRIVQTITLAANSVPPARTDPARRPRAGEVLLPKDSPTTPLPTWQLPVIVVVLSARAQFGERLTAALGSDRVAAQQAPDSTAFTRACRPFAPGAIVVDGEHPPVIASDSVADLLATLPATIVRILWAPRTPWAREVADACTRSGVPITRLGSDEDGIAPLCDIVRSLRREH